MRKSGKWKFNQPAQSGKIQGLWQGLGNQGEGQVQLCCYCCLLALSKPTLPATELQTWCNPQEEEAEKKRMYRFSGWARLRQKYLLTVWLDELPESGLLLPVFFLGLLEVFASDSELVTIGFPWADCWRTFARRFLNQTCNKWGLEDHAVLPLYAPVVMVEMLLTCDYGNLAAYNSKPYMGVHLVIALTVPLCWKKTLNARLWVFSHIAPKSSQYTQA